MIIKKIEGLNPVWVVSTSETSLKYWVSHYSKKPHNVKFVSVV